jgi:hypothetical protein
MNNSLSTYVTVYKDIGDVVHNAINYKNISPFFSITISFNVSGHNNPVELAIDLMRLWDVLTGKNVLVNRSIPGEVFLNYFHNTAHSKLIRNIGLRIVGLSDYPDFELNEWHALEKVVSYLLTMSQKDFDSITYPVSMAEHFANITRHASTSHLWILGQGDYPSAIALQVIFDLFKNKNTPDIISIPIEHSIFIYAENDEIFTSVQMRSLESISGTIYRKNYLRHMPKHNKRWWPHIESAMHEAYISDCPINHMVLGKGDKDPAELFVYVSPNPNWGKSQDSIDDVFIERYQICIHQLHKPTDRYEWWFTLDDLEYLEGLCERGRMPTLELASFLSVISNRDDSRIRLRPYSALSISFNGDIGQQIISAATYFILKLTSHIVYADFTGIVKFGSTNSSDEFVWQLEKFGIGMHIFEPLPTPPPRMLSKFVAGSEKTMQFGINALSNPGVQQLFRSNPPTKLIDMCLARFEKKPYACIHFPTVQAAELKDNFQLTTFLTRLSGLVDYVLILLPPPFPVDVENILSYLPSSFFKEIIILKESDYHLSHHLMQNAKFLACSNNMFDVTAAILNQGGIVFIPNNWHHDKNSKNSGFCDVSTILQVRV